MLLELHQASKTFHTDTHAVAAVREVSLTLDAGEFVALRGPSGSGKSTLLLMAGALLSPSQGRVALLGEDPYAMDGNARARFRAASVGFVFQQFHLVPYLNILDNVLVPAVSLRDAGSDERGRELIRRFGLEPRLDHLPSELSTGERQRVALARALLNQPRLILADEPTGNLDAENSRLVLQYLQEFAENGGGVLLVSHDEHAVAAAQRVLDMRDGQLQQPPTA